MEYSIKDIASITGGDLQTANPETTIRYIAIDSRRILFPERTLFFALVTTHRNAHIFIHDLIKAGVTNFVVSEPVADIPLNINSVRVKDGLQALQMLAAYHRAQFNYPVIGITGSNGKTIVKEWLNQLLEADHNIVRSPKSYNSQVGVPLSAWQMSPEHDLAIFEAGISTVKEMKRLEKIIHPTIGILTNVLQAHDEGFDSKEQKAKEKLKLFSDSDLVIYNSDDKIVDKAARELSARLFSWGKKDHADLKIISVDKEKAGAKISAIFQDQNILITIPFTDEASVQNAITCWCLMLVFKIPAEVIQERMLLLQAVEMRLQLQAGINDCAVIDDSYSFDLNSLEIALDFLKQQKQYTQRTIIVSDIPGDATDEQYQKVITLLHKGGISKLITIGKQWQHRSELVDENFKLYSFKNLDEFVEGFPLSSLHKELILIKGARKFGFERIVSLLISKTHQTVMEINLSAIIHNLNQHKSKLKPGTKLMAMVKAFGYGSGSSELASLLQFHQVDYLAVAYADEGIDLRKSGINLPIMILNSDEATFHNLIEYNLEPELFSFGILSSFIQYLKSQGIKNYPVHIKLDTGMHRLGFSGDDMDKLGLLISSDHITVKSVFSHLVASEDGHEDVFTRQQFDLFQECCNKLQHSLTYKFMRHIGNSAAISRHSNMQLDMVRLGIGLYGIGEDSLHLIPAATLKTTIAQIREVKEGDTVGYNRKGKVLKDSLIATIRIGYADGFRRILGNGAGKVWVNAHLAPVIGNVCMDMTMIDVTDVPGVKENDTVEIFGSNLPVQQLAAWANTISYEILTGVGQRVKRVYLQE
ncbi:MAG: bifunctional UDP-N-acetylmuramoyl-tripeptide:D-alanyl-D-alanine ligase/alanine racemase [Chitinophagaceae bacterium]|nr:bifunctional UDP-N-acetylmuramoyl-tripeptide:D-alanyl-D-alanine ligase/alanine racemase [Chitinophagaceae bacterium]